MPRLQVLYLLPGRRVVLLRLQTHGRLTHSDSRRQPTSGVEAAVGLVVIFASFLTPCAWVLSNLDQFRRH